MAAVLPIANRDARTQADSRPARRIPVADAQATIVYEGDLCFTAFWYAAGLITETDLHGSSEFERQVNVETNEEVCANLIKSLPRSSPVLPITRSPG
jgi:hypothetical protein